MSSISHSSSGKGAARRWLWRIAVLLAIAAGLVAAGYVFRAPLLAGLARAWIVDEPATKADAIVILGGGLENRPFAAAKLFHEGIAPKVLYMNVRLGPAEELGVGLSERETTRQILLSNNVPASAMVAVGTNVASTFDESRAVRAWAKQTGATSILIVTDWFHTRRARWIFRHELKDTPVKIYIVGVDPIRYKVAEWWQSEEGVIQFQNEVAKSVFYRIKY